MSEAGVTFELWRQDDNGQRFLIGSFASRGAAERRLAELTRVVHKQMYWVEKISGAGKECRG